MAEPIARPSITLGGGLQAALVVVAPVVIAVAIFARIADQPDTYIAFTAFAAVVALEVSSTGNEASPTTGR